MGIDIGYGSKRGIEQITFVPKYIRQIILVNGNVPEKIAMAKKIAKEYPTGAIKIEGKTIHFEDSIKQKDISSILNASNKKD